MPNYKLGDGKYNAEALMDHEIAKDVLGHMRQIIDQCELWKISHTERKGVAKAKHAISKIFSNKSQAHPDLYLWHPSMETQRPVAGFIRVADLASGVGRKLYYKLELLGEESKTDKVLDRNVALPNTVEINVSQNWKLYTVSMDLSGPAFFSFLSDCGITGNTYLFKKVREMLQHRWGSVGVEYGTYSNLKGNVGEGYRYIRMINGTCKVQTEGVGWIQSQPFLQ